MNIKNTALLFLCLLFVLRLSAQYGTLDAGFNLTGKIDSPNPSANSICTDGNGKIMVLGHNNTTGDFAYLTRYNSDGTPDNSFGSGGARQFDLNSDFDYGRCVKALPDGKYLICGQNSVGPYFRTFVARFKSNGANDSTFGNNGVLIINPNQSNCDAWSMEVGSSGSVYLAGYRTVGGTLKSVVWKVKSRGVLDSAFGTNGELVISTNNYTERLYGIDLDEAGNQICVTGTSNNVSTPQGIIALLDTAGTLKTTFNSTGYVKVSYSSNPTNLYDVIFNGNDIVAAGNYIVSGNTKAMLVSYTLSGTVQTSFAGNGYFRDDVSSISGYQTLVKDCDGNMYAGGNVLSNNLKVMRVSYLGAAGNLHTHFGIGGHYSTRVRSTMEEIVEGLAIYDDSGIVFGGRINLGGSASRSGIVKLDAVPCNSPLSIPSLIASGNRVLYPNPVHSGSALWLKDETGFAGNRKVRVFSLDGKLVYEGNASAGEPVVPAGIRMVPGVYTLLVVIAEKLESMQFIVE